jgi:hypothetical protein
MNRSFALAMAALLLVAAGSWFWAVRAVPSSAPAAVAHDVGDELPVSEEPAEPEEPAVEVQAPTAATPPPAAPMPAAPPPEVAVPSPEVAPVPEAHAAPTPASPPFVGLQLGSLARLKHAFEHDPVDARAREAEREISNLFHNDVNARDTLLAVRCKQRACQLELRWSPTRPYSFMAAGMALKDTINEDMSVEPIGEPDASGTRRMHVYISRTGYLPDDFDPVP